jgi:hypothetical protein
MAKKHHHLRRFKVMKHTMFRSRHYASAANDLEDMRARNAQFQ